MHVYPCNACGVHEYGLTGGLCGACYQATHCRICDSTAVSDQEFDGSMLCYACAVEVGAEERRARRCRGSRYDEDLEY